RNRFDRSPVLARVGWRLGTRTLPGPETAHVHWTSDRRQGVGPLLCLTARSRTCYSRIVPRAPRRFVAIASASSTAKPLRGSRASHFRPGPFVFPTNGGLEMTTIGRPPLHVGSSGRARFSSARNDFSRALRGWKAARPFTRVGPFWCL